MKRAVVLGGAACLWDDLRALNELVGGGAWDGLVIAVNDSGWAYPGHIDHWVSLHPEKFAAWCALRAANGYPNGYVKWGGLWPGANDSPLVDRVHPVKEVGSTGLHAALIAVGPLGCDRVVLAGTPMDAQRHFTRGQAWDMADFHRDGWTKALPKIEGRVRSMSGWTRELLGEVTTEWLARGEG